MDEVLTPDSSRFWRVGEYVEGVAPVGLDKQVLRDWLEQYSALGRRWNKSHPAPELSGEVVTRTRRAYEAIYLQLR